MAIRYAKEVTLRIPKWMDYNPRSDVTKTIWFRMQNDLLENPKFERFTSDEIITFIFILSQCSKAQSEISKIKLEVLRAHRRISYRDAWSAIRKLISLQVVEITDGTPYNGVTPTSRPTSRPASRRRYSTNERTNRIQDPADSNSNLYPPDPVVGSPPTTIELTKISDAERVVDNSTSDVDNFEPDVENSTDVGEIGEKDVTEGEAPPAWTQEVPAPDETAEAIGREIEDSLRSAQSELERQLRREGSPPGDRPATGKREASAWPEPGSVAEHDPEVALGQVMLSEIRAQKNRIGKLYFPDGLLGAQPMRRMGDFGAA